MADAAGASGMSSRAAIWAFCWASSLAAAAEYLGYGKPGSFRRARTRTPIPGETRTPDGRPAWTPGALRSWHSKLKITGDRAHTPGTD
jgi:hypothetical protein